MPEIAVATFYRFMPLATSAALRDAVQRLCDTRDIRGTVLLASEGFNATLAGRPADLVAVLEALHGMLDCNDCRPRMATCSTMPFARMKVRLKREIVTLGIAGVDPCRHTGQPVAPEDWNALLRDPAVPVIDVRNAFEHRMGHFTGSVDPGTAAFGAFPDYVRTALDPARNRAVAMFCTGGIRCEKASAFLLDQGFETVYQLEGGILAYLDRVPEVESLWRGSCFVFDGRGALGHGLRPTA